LGSSDFGLSFGGVQPQCVTMHRQAPLLHVIERVSIMITKSTGE
jgi:hypothetical protein